MTLVERLGRVCGEAPANVVSAYLFGSVARGTARNGSDLDVALLLAEEIPAVPEVFLDALERAASRSLDLIILNRAPADLIHRVLRDGIVLLDRDRLARLRFEVRARNEFFDLEPIRREYRAPRTSSDSRQ